MLFFVIKFIYKFILYSLVLTFNRKGDQGKHKCFPWKIIMKKEFTITNGFSCSNDIFATASRIEAGRIDHFSVVIDIYQSALRRTWRVAKKLKEKGINDHPLTKYMSDTNDVSGFKLGYDQLNPLNIKFKLFQISSDLTLILPLEESPMSEALLEACKMDRNSNPSLWAAIENTPFSFSINVSWPFSATDRSLPLPSDIS